MAGKLQCEICGGKLIGKPGRIFECESCGTEYSKEWAQEKIQEIKGTVKVEGTVQVEGTVKVEGGANIDSLMKRAYIALEDEEWDDAKGYFNQVLDIDAEYAEAYLGLFLVESEMPNLELDAWIGWNEWADKSKNYARALQYGDEAFRDRLLHAHAEDEKHKAEYDKKQVAEKKKKVKEEQEKKAKSKQTANRLKSVRAIIAPFQHLIAAGDDFTACIMPDGSVIATQSMSIMRDFKAFTDIIALAAGEHHLLGLKQNGTAVVVDDLTGSHGFRLEDWKNLIAIGAGSDNVAGVCANGTYFKADRHYRSVSDSFFDKAVGIDVGLSFIAGLMADGTVWYNDEKLNWDNIIGFASNPHGSSPIGLRSDGKVCVNWPDDDPDKAELLSWTDIVAISKGVDCIVGLKADRTVVALGDNRKIVKAVSKWTDIVAITAGGYHVVGLKSDGTLVAAGDNKNGQCDVSQWKLFDSIDTFAAEKKLAPKRASLKQEKETLQEELTNLKGLFSGRRRKEIEERLNQIEKELCTLG